MAGEVESPVGHAVRTAVAADVLGMVALSAAKRAAYAKAVPHFWRPAVDADAKQDAWFRHLLARDTTIALVVDGAVGLDGFVIGLVHPAPPVYDPGGLVLAIDDFCVRDPATWATVGEALLREVRTRGCAKGAVLVIVVAGVHDGPKLALFGPGGFTTTSHWFTAPI